MKAIRFNFERILIDKYFHLLIVILITFLCFPIISRRERPFGIPLITLIFTSAVLMALRAAVKNPKIFRLYALIAIMGILLDIFAVVIQEQHKYISQLLAAMVPIFFMVFLTLSIIAMLQHLFQSRAVTMDSILGGISVYFLLGFLWAALYFLITTLNPDAFPNAERIHVFYFSFTTLTTLGYGDIVPRGEFAMVLANLEAIVGQMYLAIFIARLVGLHIVEETAKRNNQD